MKKTIWIIVIAVGLLVVAGAALTANGANHKAKKYNLGCVTIPYEKPLTDCRE